MTVATAIKKIKKNKPKTFEDFTELGFNLSFLGDGAFRMVYKIEGVPLVVKIAYDSDGMGVESAISHCTAEVNKLKRLEKFPLLRPHLPKIYYHNRRAGIIVMKYYGPEKSMAKGALIYRMYMDLCWLLGRLIRKMTKNDLSDLSAQNMIFDHNEGTVKFIDLGY